MVILQAVPWLAGCSLEMLLISIGEWQFNTFNFIAKATFLLLGNFLLLNRYLYWYTNTLFLDRYSHIIGQSSQIDKLIVHIYERVDGEIKNGMRATEGKGMLQI